uniref:DUF2834 domain-containing protein n=1 Tax=Haptolina brevifila TaxID=156173 RepID=A0A7S2BJE2_9EUKA|mmetsp:Transcript_13534/g.27220  ORF Transcript_13534/g.27220 Transcript_13534/m.27220 type:complete len:189 (+) Transcript_13534:21-587(+)
MRHFAVVVLLVASTSAFIVPVGAAATPQRRFQTPFRRSRLTVGASESESDDLEVTKWARDEAANSVVGAMYLKAAADVKPPLRARAGFVFYSLYALGFTALLLKTLTAFPLIPPSPGSSAWCRGWLWTTIVDYYGAALALCGIIISTEPERWRGIAWSAACLFLGTPFCCLYVAQRLYRQGSLRLVAR